jgi:AraC-like DNA-binding protein
MKLNIKYDINLACKVILQEHLEKLDIPYEISGLGDVILNQPLAPELYRKLELSINKYGIEIVDNPKNIVVQKIKEVIVEMVFKEDKLPDSKISMYIADKLNLSYSYISKLFSEITYSSIENFIILQRIERAKQLIIEENLSLSEVAWKLNYSSNAHLSNQFKKTTGLTPTQFQRIIQKRNNKALYSEK